MYTPKTYMLIKVFLCMYKVKYIIYKKISFFILQAKDIYLNFITKGITIYI